MQKTACQYLVSFKNSGPISAKSLNIGQFLVEITPYRPRNGTFLKIPKWNTCPFNVPISLELILPISTRFRPFPGHFWPYSPFLLQSRPLPASFRPEKWPDGHNLFSKTCSSCERSICKKPHVKSSFRSLTLRSRTDIPRRKT